MPHLFLQKKDGRWHEVMVDVDYSPDAEHHLRFVLSQQSTTAAKLLLQVHVLYTYYNYAIDAVVELPLVLRSHSIFWSSSFHFIFVIKATIFTHFHIIPLT